MEYIKRSIEELVRASDNTFKCVLVTGARQTGKSTMLKALFPDKKYVPIDDPFIEEQANENPNIFMMLNPPPAFYDEVQRAPACSASSRSRATRATDEACSACPALNRWN